MSTPGPKCRAKRISLSKTDEVKNAQTRLIDLNRLYESLLKDINTRGVTYVSKNGAIANNPSCALLLTTSNTIRLLERFIEAKQQEYQPDNSSFKWEEVIKVA